MTNIRADLVSLVARRGGGRKGHGMAQELVQWANDAVAKGIDKSAIYILAGETSPIYPSEIDELFDDVLDELELPEPDGPDELLDAEMLILSQEVDRGTLTPKQAIDRAAQLMMEYINPRRFSAWVELVGDVSLMAYGDGPVFTEGLRPNNVAEHLHRIAAETVQTLRRPTWLDSYLAVDVG